MPCQNTNMSASSALSMQGIKHIYSPESHNRRFPVPGPEPPVIMRREIHDDAAQRSNKSLNARAPVAQPKDGTRWDHALMSVPPGVLLDNGYWEKGPSGDMWTTRLDDSRCQQQLIYMVESGILSHEVGNAFPPERVLRLTDTGSNSATQTRKSKALLRWSSILGIQASRGTSPTAQRLQANCLAPAWACARGLSWFWSALNFPFTKSSCCFL